MHLWHAVKAVQSQDVTTYYNYSLRHDVVCQNKVRGKKDIHKIHHSEIILTLVRD